MATLSRKKFLQNSLYSGAGIIASPFLPPNPLKESQQTIPSDLKITEVKVYALRKATFIEIQTNAGISGWGEGDHDHPKLIKEVIEEVCKKHLIDEHPFHSEYVWQQIYFKGYDVGNSGLLTGAIAGIDNALWDLKGRILGIPVYQLLGGNKIDKVQVYGSFGRSGGANGQKTPSEMAATAAEFVEKGYQCIKARMQIRQLNLNPNPDLTFEIVKAVRSAIGEETTLFVDFNNGYTPDRAIALGLKLYEHFNVVAIEEPVSQQSYESLRQVVEALPITVMAGEHDYNKWHMRDLITRGMVDVINLDTIKCGGLTECKKVAAMAHAFDKTVMMHNTRPTLATASSLHLIASMPNGARVQEYAGRRPELGLEGLFEQELQFENGHLYIPQSPGLGLTPIVSEMEKRSLND